MIGTNVPRGPALAPRPAANLGHRQDALNRRPFSALLNANVARPARYVLLGWTPGGGLGFDRRLERPPHEGRTL